MKIMEWEKPISGNEFKIRANGIKPQVGNGEALPLIINALKKLGTASAKEIAKYSGVSDNRTRIRLRDLAKDGKIIELENHGPGGTKYFRWIG